MPSVVINRSQYRGTVGDGNGAVKQPFALVLTCRRMTYVGPGNRFARQHRLQLRHKAANHLHIPLILNRSCSTRARHQVAPIDAMRLAVFTSVGVPEAESYL